MEFNRSVIFAGAGLNGLVDIVIVAQWWLGCMMDLYASVCNLWTVVGTLGINLEYLAAFEGFCFGAFPHFNATA